MIVDGHTYVILPEFFGSQPIRVAHGLLVALGCIWVALSMVRGQNPRSQLLHRQAPCCRCPVTVLYSGVVGNCSVTGLWRETV